jgi:NADPH-dependent glutamate synthase beta subunit-like oxidoreductase
MTSARGRVAIVGAGPSGKSAARELVKAGLSVTLFDREPETGGLMRYGYPDFRMPDEVSARDQAELVKLGVTIKPRHELGKEITLDGLRTGFDAVLLAIGAPASRHLGVAGEDLPGVYPALAFQHAARTGEPLAVGEKVLVIGGGDTAMDCATTALELGAEEAVIVYRGPAERLRALTHEVKNARERGVRFIFEAVPVAVTRSGDRLTLELTVVGKPASQEADTIVVAIGQDRDVGYLASLGLDTKEDGTTNDPCVFVTGDSRYGSDRLAKAILDGRTAAHQVLSRLSESSR